MKNRLLILIGVLSLSFASVAAQNFHFVYIRLESSMNYAQAAAKLDSLTKQIENEKEKFVVLFSNASPKMTATTAAGIKAIKDEFSTTSSFNAIELEDEINAMLNVFESSEICQREDGKLKLKTDIANVVVDMFVGDDFVETGMQNHLLAKFLLASDLTDNNIVVNYFNSSQLTLEKVKFNDIYRMNNLKIFIK